MDYLALKFPGGQGLTPFPSMVSQPAFPEPTIGGLLTGAFNVVMIIVTFLMFIWMVWGVFEYIFAGGDKEKIAKGRQRIIYAIVGFLLVVIAFSASKYIESVLVSSNPPVKDIQEPDKITVPTRKP